MRALSGTVMSTAGFTLAEIPRLLLVGFLERQRRDWPHSLPVPQAEARDQAHARSVLRGHHRDIHRDV
jgi:hypothetical protein